MYRAPTAPPISRRRSPSHSPCARCWRSPARPPPDHARPRPARRVSAELHRWGIAIDDSAGSPLADQPPATLLRALLACLDSGFAPVDLLALLKHPLATLGLERAVLLDAARRLDRKFLRGLKPASGLDAIRALIDNPGSRPATTGRSSSI
jgi:inactivated superfamily I helicase